ncbi:hypothetical protein [Scytonema sp. NUACC26]|uniref:hypothetical protein n=1 Tax=Scytonema sp. NUACC26 TaxID=3140176 RepID=UPI0034DB8619
MGDDVLADWVKLDEETAGEQRTREARENISPSSIVEAQGWALDTRGNVILFAQTPSVNLYQPLFTPSSCHSHKPMHKS